MTVTLDIRGTGWKRWKPRLEAYPTADGRLEALEADPTPSAGRELWRYFFTKRKVIIEGLGPPPDDRIPTPFPEHCL